MVFFFILDFLGKFAICRCIDNLLLLKKIVESFIRTWLIMKLYEKKSLRMVLFFIFRILFEILKTTSIYSFCVSSSSTLLDSYSDSYLSFFSSMNKKALPFQETFPSFRSERFVRSILSRSIFLQIFCSPLFPSKSVLCRDSLFRFFFFSSISISHPLGE